MELEKKLQELGSAFDEFKKINDARLKEMAEKGAESAATKEKMDKVETNIQKLEATIDGLKVALGRTGQGGADPEKAAKEAQALEAQKFSKEYNRFLRKGTEPSIQAQAHMAERVFGKTNVMSVDSDQDGGFLVSPEMSSEVVTKIFETSPMRALASVQTISTDMLEILEDLDEAEVGWVGERESRSVTGTPQLKMVQIPVHEIYAQPKATQKLLDDAAVNVESWLAGKVADKMARTENTSFVSGDGVKKPKGITAYASGTSFGQLERGGTASPTAIIADELIDLQTLLKEPYQANAQWLINRLIIGYVRKLKDSYGRYLWEPGLAAGTPDKLLNKPVNMASDMPSTITASSDVIAYGDFKAGYQIVDRVGIRVLRDPFTAKPFVLFYTTKRVGGGVKNFEALKILRAHA